MTIQTQVAPVPVPHPNQIRDLFLSLTGRDVELGTAHPVFPGRDLAAVSVYVTDKLDTGAVVACDLSLAACAGAALGLVPLSQVEAALAAQSLSPDLDDNFYEVANVLASVFNENPEAPHLQLHKVHKVGEQLPNDVVSMLGYVVRRMDVKIDIAGYGGGRLTVVSIG